MNPQYHRSHISAHPVGVLIIAAVLGEGCFPALGQKNLSADVAVRGGPSPKRRAQGHLTERRGATRHSERGLEPEETGQNILPQYLILKTKFYS